MGRKKQWSEVEKERAMELARRGITYREIAGKLGVTLGKVQRMLGRG